jgi:hypothetical protein
MGRTTILIAPEPMTVIMLEIGYEMLFFHAQLGELGNIGGWVTFMKDSMRHSAYP